VNFFARGTTLKTPNTADIIQVDDNSLRLALAEVRDLQRTVVVLRAELESAHQERMRQVQDAATTAHNESQQLRDTIAALRTSLEKLSQEKADAVAAATTGLHAEIAQLHETVRAMRDVLEAKS
jgi:predicted  nucleic acid-binding Zn-ribbon protein